MVKEGSYFAQTTSRAANPAEALSFRDGGVAPRDQVPEKICLKLFSTVSRREQMPQYSDDEKSCSYQARLKRQRKNSGFDRVVKGRGFSRAVRAAKSAAALAAREIAGLEKTFSATCLGVP